MSKRILFLAVFGICISGIFAQNTRLWGIAHEGGANLNDNGIIFSILDDGTGFMVEHGFLDFAKGTGPVGSPLFASNGKIYGLCQTGGAHSMGCIYSFDPNTHTYADLYDMTNAQPMDGLVEGANGNLYGVSMVGCTSGGYLFCYNFNTNTYTELHNFSTTNMHDFSSPILINNKLYGLTFNGGTSSQGVLYCYSFADSSFTVLHNFSQASGSGPMGRLMQATNGKLYGMTEISYLYGALFSFDLTTNTYSKLMEFDGTNGRSPYSGLIQLSNGDLAGAVRFGGVNGGDGVLFSFNLSNNTGTVLHTFHLADGQGATPFCDLYQGSNGLIYGSTTEGGTSNWGTVFSYNLQSGTYAVMHSFDFTNGGTPYGRLVPMNAGSGIQNFGGCAGLPGIYPCPARDLVHVTGIPGSAGELELISADGRIIRSERSLNSTCEIDVSSLHPGIYFILVRNENDLYTVKFIVE